MLPDWLVRQITRKGLARATAQVGAILYIALSFIHWLYDFIEHWQE